MSSWNYSKILFNFIGIEIEEARCKWRAVKDVHRCGTETIHAVWDTVDLLCIHAIICPNSIIVS